MPASPLWNQSRVVALFDPAPDLIGRIVSAAAEAAGIDDLPEIELEDIEEQDWVRLTQAQFEPIRVNDGCGSCPPGMPRPIRRPSIWCSTRPRLRHRLASNDLSLPAMAVRNPAEGQGESVLDYGCGSGILGIAAAASGAASVLGVDIDDNALIAARDNAASNQVALACGTRRTHCWNNSTSWSPTS
jgi:ribosomal protein L11 methyltransferase